ncbi:MAG TPA: FecR domain-containing protein [Spirochaetota bacterium]|nr:FecR domain-containing protein [Spirochaetota bacterium]
MTGKKKIVVAALLLTVCLVPTVRCNLLWRFAPTLLQGAAAIAIKGEAVMITRKGVRIRLTKNLRLSADILLMPGSRLITGRNSSVDLVFTDSIKMRIGPRTSITLDMARLLENINFSQINVRLNKGRVFATMNTLAKKSRFSISTLRSIVNVRGTEFLVEETGSSNNIIVTDGKVAVSDRGGKHLAFVDEGKQAMIAQSGTATTGDITPIQKELVDTMSANIASLTSDDKKRIRDIVENFEENRRLIREAHEAHKALISGAVHDQRTNDTKNVIMQKERDAKGISSVKSSAADELRKIRNAAK